MKGKGKALNKYGKLPEEIAIGRFFTEFL